MEIFPIVVREQIVLHGPRIQSFRKRAAALTSTKHCQIETMRPSNLHPGHSELGAQRHSDTAIADVYATNGISASNATLGEAASSIIFVMMRMGRNGAAQPNQYTRHKRSWPLNHRYPQVLVEPSAGKTETLTVEDWSSHGSMVGFLLVFTRFNGRIFDGSAFDSYKSANYYEKSY